MSFTHWMIFGSQKEGMNPDTAPKAWAEFKEALKGTGLKMKGPWGPFGVPEGACYMLKGNSSDFEKFIGTEAWQKCPIEKTRTISLFKMPWVD